MRSFWIQKEGFHTCTHDSSCLCAGPPASQANAETAVATLEESRFKEELQKALEDCNAELEDSSAELSDSREVSVDAAPQAPAQPAKASEAGAQAAEVPTDDTSFKANNPQAMGVLGSQQSPAASGECPSPSVSDSSVLRWAHEADCVIACSPSSLSCRFLRFSQTKARFL